MTEQKIIRQLTDRYKISQAYLERIDKFKDFVGPENFELILNGVAEVDVPFEKGKFNELMEICLLEKPTEPIPYDDAEEILSFFCKPFAGKYLRQAKYTLDGISSILQNLDPKVIQTLMGSGTFPNPSGISTDASSSRTEILNKEKDIIN